MWTLLLGRGHAGGSAGPGGAERTGGVIVEPLAGRDHRPTASARPLAEGERALRQYLQQRPGDRAAQGSLRQLTADPEQWPGGRCATAS
ncbi:hypothetical protein [Rhodanobacter lindaniclasticus]